MQRCSLDEMLRWLWSSNRRWVTIDELLQWSTPKGGGPGRSQPLGLSLFRAAKGSPRSPAALGIPPLRSRAFLSALAGLCVRSDAPIPKKFGGHRQRRGEHLSFQALLGKERQRSPRARSRSQNNARTRQAEICDHSYKIEELNPHQPHSFMQIWHEAQPPSPERSR